MAQRTSQRTNDRTRTRTARPLGGGGTMGDTAAWVEDLRSRVVGMLEDFQATHAKDARTDAQGRARFVHDVSKAVAGVRDDVARTMAGIQKSRARTSAADAIERGEFAAGVRNWAEDLRQTADTMMRGFAGQRRDAARKGATRRRQELTELRRGVEGLLEAFAKDHARARTRAEKDRAQVLAQTRDAVSAIRSEVDAMLANFRDARTSFADRGTGRAPTRPTPRSFAASTPAPAQPPAEEPRAVPSAALSPAETVQRLESPRVGRARRNRA